jgi:Fe-S cluster assembly iron-binding protein IscA
MRDILKVACAILLAWVCPALALASASVSVSPTTVQVLPGGQAQFAATVSGGSSSVVIWSLTGTNCSGIACGQITNGGLYLAPAVAPKPNVVTVTATSLADLSASASAAVIVGTSSDVKVTVSPASPSILTGQQQKFVAFVSGTTITGVTWRLTGSACANSDCGTITSSGIYTAPATLAQAIDVTVEALSVADPTRSGSAVITVTPPVAVTVSPASASVVAGKQQQFTATVRNTSNTAVTWSVAGSGCSGSACGTITTGGLYTAPAAVPSPAQIFVTATSVADSSKSSKASVTILAPVGVTVSPASAQVLTGGHQQFAATVSNSNNTAVTWSVAGSGCRGSACGTITTGGLFTAPAAVPNPAQVSITATSVADPTKSSKATVTILAVGVTLSPTTAQVLTGGHQQFAATVTNTSNTSVTWSVSGSGCSGSGCGTVSASGLYTAPSSAPKPNQVTVTATSVADPSKSAQALVTIAAPVSVTISPTSAQVVLSATQQFLATVSGSSNQSVSWKLTGPGCSGASCGTITSTGLYTAPAALPNPAQVFVTATAAADPSKSSTASVTIVPPVGVTISPTTATVVASGHQQFLASVSGTTNTGVTWSVSGSGCSGAACGTVSPAGLYTAPATLPSPAKVVVKVASAADSSKFATAAVTLIPPVAVTISPSTARVVAGNHQQFSATVTGNSNTAVTWSVSGSGCSGSACGTISATGLYSAPATVPSPAEVQVTAKSAADSSKSASATVTIVAPPAVTVSPLQTQVVVSGHQQFTATVSGATNTAVTWSLKGSGCSGASCGTVTSAGLYTAPATVPSPANVTLTATSAADPTKSASASITIIPPVNVTISPTSVVIAVKDQQQFQARVTGANNTSVAWSVSGAGCSGSACGTISSSGLYTAPAVLPSPATILVKAASQIDPSRSASATVTLTATPNARLNGHYAFQFMGIDSSATYQSAGSFTADGDGKITGGLEDINSIAGPATAVPFTGTYQIGSDNRGSFTFSTSTGTQTFSFALNSTNTGGRFIELDTTGIRGSGLFEKQDVSAFAVAALKGSYVASLAGEDSAGNRIGSLALLYFTGLGSIPGGTMDVNDGGIAPPTFGALNGVYRVDPTGRGTLNLSVPGFDGGSFRFAFYVVSAQKLLLVSIDRLSSDNPIFSGPAEVQTGAPFLTASFSGPTVFSLSGEQGHVSQVEVGRILFDGQAQPLVQFDENAGGTITTGKVLTGAYAVEVNGPGTINLDDSNGHEEVWRLYAISPNHAFLMDASSSAVGMGELVPQPVHSPFSAGDILGSYLLGSGEPLVSGATLFSGFTSFDGRNAMSGTEDVSEQGGLLRAQPLAGSYTVSNAQNNGRGTLTLPASKKSFALWIASPSEVLGLELDSTNAQPVVLYFEQ